MQAHVAGDIAIFIGGALNAASRLGRTIMRMIFVNMPVKNIQATRKFFDGLGFSFNPQFSDDHTACMKVDENIYVMLLEEERFKDFIIGEISDNSKGKEVLTCLSCDSRADVEATYAKAIAAGAKPWKPAIDYGSMYGCSFLDLDGHVWEFMWMDPANVQPA
jgi:predicted lactoylglutathione lyase